MAAKRSRKVEVAKLLEPNPKPGEYMTAEQRVARAERDFDFFCRYYLGNYFSAEPAPFHRDLAAMFAHSRVAVAAPREHAKSTLVFAHLLHQVLSKKVHFIVIFRYPDLLATQTVSDLREELVSNERIIADFGNLIGSRKWAEGELVTSTNIKILALGRNSGARGVRHQQWRPDLVVVDDIEDDSSVESKDQRTKMERWFRRVVSNVVGREGRLFVIGTILHHDSLLSNLIARKDVYVTRRWAATPEAPLWPAQWPADRLAAKRAEIGARDFAQEFANDPANEEDQIFTAASWSHYDDDELKGLKLDIVGAIDPAVSSKKTADETAIAVVGEYRHPRGGRTIYILDLYAQRLPPQKQVALAINVKRRWPRMVTFGVEAIAYQQALLDMIRSESNDEGVQMNAVPVVDIASDKLRRIARIVPMFERGEIRWPAPASKYWKPEMQKAMDQFERLGVSRGGHDDLPDAIERAVSLLDRGRRSVRASIL